MNEKRKRNAEKKRSPRQEEKYLKKELKKLNPKRNRIKGWLEFTGVEVPDTIEHIDLIKLAYKEFKNIPERIPDNPRPIDLHSCYNVIINWDKRVRVKPKKKEKKQKKQKGFKPRATGIFTTDMNAKIAAFYRSYEWRKLRMVVLKKYGARCQCCGATRADGVSIHVDHIKSLRKFWELRLVEGSLQVLCEVCNHGKGNWDDTDWRDTLTAEYNAMMAEG
ncbi:MAG TPA: hypothetical protein ENH62_03245 [Marinobacter sp.]|uniref:HNH domain-containing protein n=1 Tax=marine sediment metagenome TaxID=412755 RepID=A0A0F9R0S1_9ZZZZ|nr:hypothetical protein [Marinobacter sp.]